MEDLEVAPAAKGPPMLNRSEIISKFETFFDKPLDGCWLWNGRLNDQGYGLFDVNCGTDRAHRISWIIYVGEIPSGRHILHRCDVPRCIRPDHLFAGGALENRLDCKAKGRDSAPPIHRGQENAKTKLYDRDVRRIRELITQGVPQVEIARRFGVTSNNIRSIRLGLSWNWLP